MLGLVLYADQTKFINKLLNNKLLSIRAAENVVRLLPPLNVTRTEISLALKIIENVCGECKWKILLIFPTYHQKNLDQ